MERVNLSKLEKITERGVMGGGQAVVFIYEKEKGKKVLSCKFSAFENETSDKPIATGEVVLEHGSFNIYFTEPVASGSISLIAEILKEIEDICELKPTEETEDGGSV